MAAQEIISVENDADIYLLGGKPVAGTIVPVTPIHADDECGHELIVCENCGRLACDGPCDLPETVEVLLFAATRIDPAEYGIGCKACTWEESEADEAMYEQYLDSLQDEDH